MTRLASHRPAQFQKGLALSDFQLLNGTEKFREPTWLAAAQCSWLAWPGLACFCFCSVITTDWIQEASVIGGKHPNDLPSFRWINTLQDNLKTSPNGTCQRFNVDAIAQGYGWDDGLRFNRRLAG